MKFLKSFILVTFSFFCMITPAFASVPGIDESMGKGATKGIVSVSHPLAAEAGIKILKQGGNAVDAAAAIQLSLNVVEPMMSGIGGGGFIMIYNKKENKITMIDSREMAPQNVTPELFLDEKGKPVPFSKRHTTGKAVAVPGTLKGMEAALEKYGTLKLSQVMDPAIKQAEKGVKVNWITAQYIDENVKKLENNQAAAKVFVPNGKQLEEGDTLVQPDLAKTLKLIKKQGSNVFYKGEIGEALTKEVQKREGTMTTEDLENYVVKERKPIKSEYRGFEVVGAASPSSGSLTVQQILELMEGFDVQKMGANSPEYLHYLTEAMHLAFADRAAYMADEDFYDVPTKGLLDEDYIKERRKLINPNRSTADVKAGDPWKYEGKEPISMEKVKEEKTPIGQTTHFSVMDKWGNMVAYTTTIEQVFGSGIMVPDYGFMLNNEMTDFDATPGGVNQVEPGKRPRSSMSPTFVLKDGNPFMAIGSPGGATIIASVSETIMNVLDHQMLIQDAILAPRIYSAGYPTVRWEPGIEQNTRLELMAKGHVYEEKPQHIGNVQAVIFDYEKGKMYGGADNTREGTVQGVYNVSYKSKKPKEIKEEKKGPFTLKVNGAVYPYTAEQMKLIDEKPYIQSDKLLLGLGVIQSGDLETFKPDKKSYLPVLRVAKSLGYKAKWNEKDKEALLEKDPADIEDPDEDGSVTN
ncbi:gamma-glutamyltransferase [Peribacillus simplex]|uniref:Glutathione hydrolase proenzyme n=3 Tax=Peribacillus simplex TaxID=1478 RepID=A0A223EBQ3_9BACI|nr:gamma-glutamyltransferase [Peribacillus simplex]ASS92684.1 gamma-glutamyltransferase [Peribacillus simplex NBRC 15720 = DSM 1321]MEC1398299.1 gamma-glutamyltransferase [Peribacillus simplex]MED3911714.1 gamma-glutamyltransferase [Peribacillus simplex]TVX78090.1 gamma-glutamyltransferase [Peribacillus simplex]